MTGSIPRYLSLGNLRIDNKCIELTVSEQKIDVTLIEMKILKELVEHYPRMMQRKDLGRSIWGDDEIVMPKTISTHLSNLRLKLGQWNFKIESVKNVGIRLKLE